MVVALCTVFFLDLAAAEGPPGPPQNITAETGHRWVLLTWDPPVDDGGSAITNYYVKIGNSIDSMETMAYLGDVLSYNRTDMMSGVKWYFAIYASNGNGRGNLSQVINVTRYGPPTEPLDASAQGEQGRVLLTWTPPEDPGGFDILGYNITRGLDRTSMESLVSLNAEQDSYADPEIVNGTEYYYGISAYTEYGTGDVTIRKAMPFGPPPVPNITVARAMDDGWELEWEMPENDGGSPIYQYHFYETTNPEFFPAPTRVIDHLPLIGQSHTGLEKGRTYYVKMQWGNKHGLSDFTETFVFNVTSEPDEPYNLHASRTKDVVSLLWVAPFDNGLAINGYLVFRYSEADRDWELIGEIGPTNTTYTDTGLTEDGEYSYMVRAVNSKGTSEDSEAVSIDWKRPDDGNGGLGVPGHGTISALVVIFCMIVVYRRRRVGMSVS